MEESIDITVFFLHNFSIAKQT